MSRNIPHIDPIKYTLSKSDSDFIEFQNTCMKEITKTMGINLTEPKPSWKEKLKKFFYSLIGKKMMVKPKDLGSVSARNLKEFDRYTDEYRKLFR